jgi:hypothetical protein
MQTYTLNILPCFNDKKTIVASVFGNMAGGGTETGRVDADGGAFSQKRCTNKSVVAMEDTGVCTYDGTLNFLPHAFGASRCRAVTGKALSSYLGRVCNKSDAVYLISSHKSVFRAMFGRDVRVGDTRFGYVVQTTGYVKWNENFKQRGGSDPVIILICCQDGYAKNNSVVLEKHHRIDPGLTPVNLETLDHTWDELGPHIETIIGGNKSIFACASYLFRSQLTTLLVLNKLKPSHPLCTNLYPLLKTINYERYHPIVRKVASWFKQNGINDDVMLDAYRTNVEKISHRATSWSCIQLIRVRAEEQNMNCCDDVEALIGLWNKQFVPTLRALSDDDTSIVSSLAYKYAGAFSPNEQKTVDALLAASVGNGNIYTMSHVLRSRVEKDPLAFPENFSLEHALSVAAIETQQMEKNALETSALDEMKTMVGFVCYNEKIVSKYMKTEKNDCVEKTEDQLTVMMKDVRTYRSTFDTFRHEFIYRSVFMKDYRSL